MRLDEYYAMEASWNALITYAQLGSRECKALAETGLPTIELVERVKPAPNCGFLKKWDGALVRCSSLRHTVAELRRKRV